MDLSKKPEKDTDNCPHKWGQVWEDHILMGNIYYGLECALCGEFQPREPGPLELGIYK